MRKNFRRYARVLLSLSAGLLLLWLIMRGQDTGLLRNEFRNANYFWVFAAMGCAILSHYIRAIRWNRIIRAMGYKTKDSLTFYAVMTGYLTNLAVPRMGEITRCVTLSKASGTPFSALAGTVVAERVFDFLTLAGIIVVTISLQFSFLKTFLRQIFWDPLISRGRANWELLAAMLALALIIGLIAMVVIRRKSENPGHGSLVYKIKRQFRGFVFGLKAITRMQGKRWFVLHSLLIWGLYYLTVYLCFFAISATSGLTAIAGLTLLTVGSIGILAPVPGGIGTYHFLTIITLKELYGISPEAATSYAYITHATQIAVNVVFGLLSWMLLSVRKK